MTQIEEAVVRQALIEEAALQAMDHPSKDARFFAKSVYEYLMAAPEPPAQQEPVAWMYQCSADSSGPVLMQSKKDWAESGSGLWTETPLYTRPQAREPLTDEQRLLEPDYYRRDINGDYHLADPQPTIRWGRKT